MYSLLLCRKKRLFKIWEVHRKWKYRWAICLYRVQTSFCYDKRTDGAGDWAMMDNKRPNEFNVVQNYLKAQAADTEQTDDSFNIDILSNGWKARYNNGNYNASSGSYVYMAFAEAPFVTSTGIPTTAR